METTQGTITNIGNICGKQEFLDYGRLKSNFNREYEIYTYKETIAKHQKLIPSYHLRINDLRRNGADDCQRIVKYFVNRNSPVPSEIVETLARMLKTKDPRIIKHRKATEQEKEMLVVSGEKQTNFVQEQIGYVEGLEAISTDNDLRKILIEDLENGLSALKELNLENCSKHLLSKHAKWCEEIEEKFNKASNAIGIAQKFCQKENLTNLKKLISSDTERKAYLKYLNTIKTKAKASNLDRYTLVS